MVVAEIGREVVGWVVWLKGGTSGVVMNLQVTQSAERFSPSRASQGHSSNISSTR